jgi:hypothetical protein
MPNVHRYGGEVDAEQVKTIDVPPSVLQRLTTFNLTCNWTADYVLKLLQHCTNVETLNVDFGDGIYNEWSRDNPFMQSIAEGGIVLPKCHTLELCSMWIPVVADLHLLKLPALRNLSITFGEEYWYVGEEDEDIMSPQSAHDLPSFLRGNATLESLTITSGVLKGDTLFDVLKCSSSLKHLTVNNVAFSADVFSKISSQRLLPRLESIDFLLMHRTKEEIGGLQHLVEDRGIKLTFVQCTNVYCGYVEHIYVQSIRL